MEQEMEEETIDISPEEVDRILHKLMTELLEFQAFGDSRF